MPGYFLLIACLLFSFACNLIKKLYDNHDYSTINEMLKSAAVSGLAGFLFAMLLSEFFASPILIILLSGLGGFFGIKGLNMLVQSNVSSKVFLNDAIKDLLEETDEEILFRRVQDILKQDREQYHNANDTPQGNSNPEGDNQSIDSQNKDIHEESQDNHIKIHVIRTDSS